MGDVTEDEKLIEQHLQENNQEAAVRLLVKLIVKYARKRNFHQAQCLRDRLLEVDPLAVREIVKTGEVIETEKGLAIDKSHLAIWAGFYENLTAEETNALFYGMKMVEYSANQMIFKQGERGARLYFIDQGRLKMFSRQDDKSILLKILGPGDIFGEDTFFFSDAFCTTSVMTDSSAKLYVLSKDELNPLHSKLPGLESKLYEYCSTLESVAELLTTKKLERRASQRLSAPGKILVQIHNQSDQPEIKSFKAELLDISGSGLAFLMKTTFKSSAMLLGRSLSMKLTFDELASELEVNCTGTVVAVNSEPFHEYVVHAEFNTNLASSIIDDLENLIDPT